MIPTIIEVYEATVDGLNSASRLDSFGSRLLVSGKSPTLEGPRRENWLRDYISAALRIKGFATFVERERVDISVWTPDGVRPLAVMEVKFLYTHGPQFFAIYGMTC